MTRALPPRARELLATCDERQLLALVEPANESGEAVYGPHAEAAREALIALWRCVARYAPAKRIAR